MLIAIEIHVDASKTTKYAIFGTSKVARKMRMIPMGKVSGL
ncbi:hypothetical protein [Cytobacillus sp. IB215665]|nr:hypothetical protein [Cytobacillus sp. IB215665]MDX8365255.1 hypothetical protein [Cytobacillus sp. IB215665]